MIQVTFHKNFIKKYYKLSRRIQVRVDDRLSLFQKDPKNGMLCVHQLQGKLDGYFSMNIGGDLRIVFRVLPSEVVQLKDIGTHSSLYD